jgi:outer membrane protein TolC
VTDSQTPAPAALPLAGALAQAEQHNLQLKLAAIQVPKAKTALDRTDALTGSALEQALLQRYGVPLPADDSTTAALHKSGELTIEQAALGLDATRQSVRMAVTKAYLDWQKASALADAAAQALTRAQAQADTVKAAVAAGTAANYDQLQANAQVAAQKAALLDAQNGRSLARLALQRQVGVELTGQPGAISPTDTGDAPGDPKALLESALAQRPDVAVARLTVSQKEADLDLLSQYLPADDPTVAGARLAVEEAGLLLASLQADIELQVGQATLAISSARERILALQDGAAQAREALRLAQLRYTAGAATNIEVISAQTALTQAETAQIQAAADLAASRASLQQALGAL